jgi:Sap, sulfolipid-1-addressing protein
MWGTVLVLALMIAPDPPRLGIAVLLISRPRPLHNLLAYWLGGMAAGIAPGLGVLILPRGSLLLMIMKHVTSTIARFTGGYTQIAIGVLALLIAALVLAGFPVSQHQEAPIDCGAPSGPVLQPTTPAVFSRLTARARHALEGGHPAVAFVAGLGSAVPPVEYLVVLTIIVSSGAAIATQLGAVVMFTVAVLALFEVALVSYLAMPAKTQAAMVLLQNWLRAHRRRILAVIATVAGVWLVTSGVGSV